MKIGSPKGKVNTRKKKRVKSQTPYIFLTTVISAAETTVFEIKICQKLTQLHSIYLFAGG